MEEVLMLLGLFDPTSKGLIESMKQSKTLIFMVIVAVCVILGFFVFLANSI